MWGDEGQPGAGHECRSGGDNPGQDIQQPDGPGRQQGAERNERRNTQKNQNRAPRVDQSWHPTRPILLHNAPVEFRGGRSIAGQSGPVHQSSPRPQDLL
jgi:hypothetical protein